MPHNDEIPYSKVTSMLGLKVVPGEENNIRGKAEKYDEVIKSFKALGQFDVILLLNAKNEELHQIAKKIGSISNVIDVFIVKMK